MAKTATDFPDPGMLEHLRELAAAGTGINIIGGAVFGYEEIANFSF